MSLKTRPFLGLRMPFSPSKKWYDLRRQGLGFLRGKWAGCVFGPPSVSEFPADLIALLFLQQVYFSFF